MPEPTSTGPDGASPSADHGERALAVLRRFREVFRAVQQQAQAIEERCGVSGAQLWVLCELAEHPDLKVSQLARALSVHPSTASNLLVKLEGRHLIERQRGQADRRVVRLRLTAAGQALVERAPQPARGVLPEALRRLPDAVLDELGQQLRMLLDLMQAQDPTSAQRPLAE